MLKSIQKRFEVKFFKVESLGGILLFGMTIFALIWANSPWSESYYKLWNFKIGISATGFELVKPLYLWINDGLMAIFFFLIGLEIKRELMIGGLNTPKKAAFPIFAALGGMSIPALMYVFLNNTTETADGWAIPMATDIAFSLAILQLLGKRVHINVKIFLTAFAIVDDLGAVLVIALFYSGGIDWAMIAGGIGLVVLLFFIAQRFYSKFLMIIVGIVVWYLFLKGGVHPTIAGVLLAFTIPISQRVKVPAFVTELENIIGRLKNSKSESSGILTREQLEDFDELDDITKKTHSPLQHLEHGLHNWVAYLIMPIFALANAGVAISASASLDTYLIFIIAAALVLGNAIGINAILLIAEKLKLANLPEQVGRRQVLGVSFLAGVGFTMSIFIANLAFAGNSMLLDSSKIGILVGSLVSGLIGYMILRSSPKPGGSA